MALSLLSPLAVTDWILPSSGCVFGAVACASTRGLARTLDRPGARPGFVSRLSGEKAKSRQVILTGFPAADIYPALIFNQFSEVSKNRAHEIHVLRHIELSRRVT